MLRGPDARAITSRETHGQQDEQAMPSTAPQTLYDKIFEDHVVSRQPDFDLPDAMQDRARIGPRTGRSSQVSIS